jgi:16S rRNA (guanine527-N7)-methyltransferase
LADSIAKKLKVVDAVAEGIGLSNISTRHTRAEDIKNQKFDFAVSRAVAPLKELWTWARPLLKTKPLSPDAEHKPGLICLKGGDLALEIQESGTRPHMIEIKELFQEEYFQEKYLLYVPR